MSELTLNIITPQGSYGPFSCDSIRLTVCDNLNGKGGGSYGIRSGHIQSLLSLEQGAVKAFRSGKEILAGECGGGFATVENDTVTAVVETFQEKSDD